MHQSAERVLQPGVERERHAVLVDLGPERQRLRQIIGRAATTSCYLLALQAIYEYWVTDGNNETVGGVPMIQTAFMSVWNWDARPFPTFPNMVGVWGDTGNWPAGNWLGGKGPFLTPLVPSDPPHARALFDLPVGRRSAGR